MALIAIILTYAAHLIWLMHCSPITLLTTKIIFSTYNNNLISYLLYMLSLTSTAWFINQRGYSIAAGYAAEPVYIVIPEAPVCQLKQFFY